ncbi:hypothetical protein [Micromonospora sp. CA-246542]|uniref:hypothetical protein n=1 Tax=Micromonospora sp. CA-246542 TaxID=3239959 RepID=UPI003D935337
MPDAEDLVAEALAAVRGTDVRQTERQLDRLMVGTGTADGATAVDAALARRLIRGLGRLWPRGWQPVDVHRIARWRLDAGAARLVRDALAAQRREQAEPVPAWWDDQLRVLAAQDRDAAGQGSSASQGSKPARGRDAGQGSKASRDVGPEDLVADWTRAEGLDRVDALRTAVDVLALVEGLPPIAVLRPPPGSAGTALPAPPVRPAAGRRCWTGYARCWRRRSRPPSRPRRRR